MKRYGVSVIAGLLLLTVAAAYSQAAALTAAEIIRKMEGNQTHKTALSSGTMTIYDKYGETRKSFTMAAEGAKAMLLEFTNPEDAGQKILRIDNEIYLYFPKSEKTLIIQGSALKDRVMGSDFSYEDMAGGSDLLATYKATLLGTETAALEDDKGNTTHVACYKIKLEALNKKKVVYPVAYLWVDTERMVYRKTQSCTADDKVLKEMVIIDIKTIEGKNIPVYLVMRDTMKKTSKTVFKIDDMKLGIKLDPDTFGLKELAW